MIDAISITTFFILIASTLVLWKSSDYAVQAVLKIASLFDITTLFSGFVIMAISTGIPEFAVTLHALISKASEISAANILGSNVVDCTLVLGIPLLLVKSMSFEGHEHKNIVMVHIIATFAMILVFFMGHLNWWKGLILILGYFFTLWFMWKNNIVIDSSVEELHENGTELLAFSGRQKLFKKKMIAISLFFISIIAVLLSSKIVVISAINLAKKLKLSFEAIGATVVAIGTSLPELSLNIQAARKKEYALAIGNSLGSVFEQGTLILGFLAITSPQPIKISLIQNVIPFIFAALAVIGYGLIKRKKLELTQGAILLGIFLIFIVFQLLM